MLGATAPVHYIPVVDNLEMSFKHVRVLLDRFQGSLPWFVLAMDGSGILIINSLPVSPARLIIII